MLNFISIDQLMFTIEFVNDSSFHRLLFRLKLYFNYNNNNIFLFMRQCDRAVWSYLHWNCVISQKSFRCIIAQPSRNMNKVKTYEPHSRQHTFTTNTFGCTNRIMNRKILKCFFLCYYACYSYCGRPPIFCTSFLYGYIISVRSVHKQNLIRLLTDIRL